MADEQNFLYKYCNREDDSSSHLDGCSIPQKLKYSSLNFLCPFVLPAFSTWWCLFCPRYRRLNCLVHQEGKVAHSSDWDVWPTVQSVQKVASDQGFSSHLPTGSLVKWSASETHSELSALARLLGQSSSYSCTPHILLQQFVSRCRDRSTGMLSQVIVERS